jgi:hypothetical protein
MTAARRLRGGMNNFLRTGELWRRYITNPTEI